MPHGGDGFARRGEEPGHTALPSPPLHPVFAVCTQQRYQVDLIFRDETSHLSEAE